jgi:C4-dicarboxylate transporter/malic acid transport protein
MAVINLTPSWFTVNMGTGIVTIMLYNLPYQFDGQQIVAMVFYAINIIVFLNFLVMTIARYIMYPWLWSHTIHHNAHSLFIGALPMALATIVTSTALILVPRAGDWAVTFVWALWWIDVILSVLSSFVFPVVMFHYNELTIDKMTAAWALPIVPALVAGTSGATVSTVQPVDRAFITLLVSYGLWAIGFGLCLLILAIYVHRLAVHRLPSREVIITAFLPLGFFGQGALGLVQMGQSGRRVFPEVGFLGVPLVGEITFTFCTISGVMMWGLSLWWAVHAFSSIGIRIWETGLVKYSIGFWGFIFPLGSFTAATIALGKVIPSAFLNYLSVVMIFPIIILYLFVAFRTIYAIIFDRLLEAPCLGDLKKRIPQEINGVPVNVSAPEANNSLREKLEAAGVSSESPHTEKKDNVDPESQAQSDERIIKD